MGHTETEYGDAIPVEVYDIAARIIRFVGALDECFGRDSAPDVCSGRLFSGAPEK